MGESENGYLILDHLDSSLPEKRKIQKRIFLYLESRSIYCLALEALKKKPGILFFIIEELLDCNLERQQLLQR